MAHVQKPKGGAGGGKAARGGKKAAAASAGGKKVEDEREESLQAVVCFEYSLQTQRDIVGGIGKGTDTM